MPAWQAQYGPWPGSFFAPQKRNSDWAGSPIGQWHIDSRNSTMVTGSDIGTTTSLTVWGAAASITNGCKARAVLPTTCGLFACRWAARRGALWCGGEAGTLPGSPLGTPDRPEPVDLADHRVTGNPMGKFASDTAGAPSFEPEFLQQLDSFIGPGHLRSIRCLTGRPSRHRFEARGSCTACRASFIARFLAAGLGLAHMMNKW